MTAFANVDRLNGAALVGLLLTVSGSNFAIADDARVPLLYAKDLYTYDNNLYRLPAAFATDVIGPNLSREDHINTVSVGGFDELRLGEQFMDFEFQVANNRFAQNTDLNNTSGVGKVTWDWRFTPLLTGDAGGDFTRSLAGYANTRFLGRDLVDTGEYFADAQLRFAAHWRINAGIRNADTTHSLAERSADNFRSRSGNVGVEYLMSDTDSLGFEYRYIKGSFPHLIRINNEPFDRSYGDNTGKFFLKYAISGKTFVDASVGYLRRSYPDNRLGEFSGNTWRGSLVWQLSGKTQIKLAGWRDLTAYLDSESDYFVSRGESIATTWNATERIDVVLSAAWNDQRYIGASPSVIELESRHDRLRTQQASLKYSPRDWLTVELAYRLEERDSTQIEFPYSDKVASANVTVSR